MKIDLSKIDTDVFVLNKHEFYGENLYLIYPKNPFFHWTENDLIFRSSVWNEEGYLVSPGFKKFFNWSERPDLHPYNNDNFVAVEKIDGSCLIVSNYKDHYIYRTRGTISAFKLDNGHEITPFKNDLESKIDLDYNTTLLFEWTTPNNRIVLDYGSEPEFRLIGGIDIVTYTLFKQSILDEKAITLNVKRPHTYSFKTMGETQSFIENNNTIEGVCIYYDDEQHIRKLKTENYLQLHRLKSELNSIEKLLDIYIEIGQPSYNDFVSYLTNNFDFEIMTMIRGNISKILDAKKQVTAIINHMVVLVDKIRSYETRKSQAEVILQAYGNTNRSGFAFKILDNKELSADDWKKLYFQLL